MTDHQQQGDTTMTIQTTIDRQTLGALDLLGIEVAK